MAVARGGQEEIPSPAIDPHDVHRPRHLRDHLVPVEEPPIDTRIRLRGTKDQDAPDPESPPEHRPPGPTDPRVGRNTPQPWFRNRNGRRVHRHVAERLFRSDPGVRRFQPGFGSPGAASTSRQDPPPGKSDPIRVAGAPLHIPSYPPE
jgi:hypothetical protein